METARPQTICWVPLWNEAAPAVGLEHLLLANGSADSVILAVGEDGRPFRLAYQLLWTPSWQLRQSTFSLSTHAQSRSLVLRTNGQGQWHEGDGPVRHDLDGCLDIDVWPTPFTNSFPLRRQALAIGERREYRMAWVCGPDLTVRPQAQAYTRLADRLYRFESLDGSGFEAELPVDGQGLVLDYPGLFRRVSVPSG